MQIDPKDRIPISKAHLILKTGKTSEAVRLWVRVGLLNKRLRKRVRLKTRQWDGGVYTTREWYQDFQDKLNEGGE